MATAWLFINITLTMFDWVELDRHLPVYGVMSVLLIWPPRKKTSASGLGCLAVTRTTSLQRESLDENDHPLP